MCLCLCVCRKEEKGSNHFNTSTPLCVGGLHAAVRHVINCGRSCLPWVWPNPATSAGTDVSRNQMGKNSLSENAENVFMCAAFQITQGGPARKPPWQERCTMLLIRRRKGLAHRISTSLLCPRSQKPFWESTEPKKSVPDFFSPLT